MAKVVWTRGALSELQAIRVYIEEFSPKAAQRMAARLMEAARSLENKPDRGRPIGRDRRELTIIPPYLIRYQTLEERVIILEIRHSARFDEAED